MYNYTLHVLCTMRHGRRLAASLCMAWHRPGRACTVHRINRTENRSQNALFQLPVPVIQLPVPSYRLPVPLFQLSVPLFQLSVPLFQLPVPVLRLSAAPNIHTDVRSGGAGEQSRRCCRRRGQARHGREVRAESAQLDRLPRHVDHVRRLRRAWASTAAHTPAQNASRCVCKHRHVCICIYIHIYVIYIYIQTYICTYKQTYIYAYIPTHRHIYR